MGLDTSHDAFHGGYGGFNILRHAIAAATQAELGLPMNWPQSIGLPDGYFDEGIPDDVRDRLGMGTFTEDEMPPEPVLVLLLHEDCDGIIPTFACGPLADQLERLVYRIDAETAKFAPAWVIPEPRNTTAMTREFIAGLRRAVAAGEDLVFA